MINPAQAENAVLCDLARRMGEAEKGCDAEFFKSLLAETLTFRRASGVVVDRRTFLKDLLNRENAYDLLEPEDVSATVHEGVAVATLLVRAKGMREGKPFSGVYRNIRIFVHDADKPAEGQWQLHAWFNVPVSDRQPAGVELSNFSRESR
jgi:hypothetical protein